MSFSGGGSTSDHKAIMSSDQKHQQSTGHLKKIFSEKYIYKVHPPSGQATRSSSYNQLKYTESDWLLENSFWTKIYIL